ncbi:MAG: hypothetical protein AAF572_16150 [Cyanobacteria bacterium P01_B01_bin.77]
MNQSPKTGIAQSSRQAIPLALLGMLGIGLPLRWEKSQRRKQLSIFRHL